jgi:uncharacterized protein (TIGR00297 family)
LGCRHFFFTSFSGFRARSGHHSHLKMQLASGFLIAVVIAYAAYRAKSLNRSGALAAIVVGTVIFGIGGWRWAVILLTFFVTSSALTRAFKKRKSDLSEKFSKGGQRDAGQVFGNGGLATLFAGLTIVYPDDPRLWLGFAAALAASNADTWATELGVLNPHPPRLITHPMRIVEKGNSGGVSLVGTLAALAGAGLLGVLAGLLNPDGASWSSMLLVSLAGLLGSLFDSLLGSTVQAIYRCPSCEKETEQHPVHSCGTPTIRIRGWMWLNNDWVNFGCGAFAVVVALFLQ